ncbi:hypothetical protein B9Z55_027981 [Caenorhabditis nigoni]|nr:hypothetical protein B9Z55_027981 [Caenorhabditis nigoni]
MKMITKFQNPNSTFLLLLLSTLPHARRRHRRSHRRRIQIQNPRRHHPEVKPKECGLLEKAPELEKFENVAGWERSDSFEAVYGDLEEKSAKDPSTCRLQKHFQLMPVTAFSAENTFQCISLTKVVKKPENGDSFTSMQHD